MGRHGTQRGGGTRRALALTLIPLLLLAAVGGGYLWWTDRPTTAAAAAAQGTQPCAAPLQVLVAAELAPVAREVLSADGADGCRVAEVRSTASAQSAVQAIGTGQVPDVWVPDSSTWLDALPGSGDLPTAPDGWEQGPSVATSPVVLVSPTAGKTAVAAPPTSWSDQDKVSGHVRIANPDTASATPHP